MPSERSRVIGTKRSGSGVSLLKRRTWFDEQGSGQQGDGGSPPAGSGGVTVGKYTFATLEEASKIIEALNKRVGERDADAETLAQRLKAIEDAGKKQLAEQGNYKALAEQHAAEVERLRAVEARANALDATLRKSNEARIARVPEQYRSMIPTDYAPEKLQDWLDANEALLGKPPAPNFDAGAGGSGGGSRTTDLTPEEKQMAAAMGLTAEQYAKQKLVILQRKQG